MTADSALYIPPYKADDQDIVVELNSRFGAETFTVQPTRTGMPVLWVPRERLIEVLTFLRQVPKPYVMLYDLHGVDERLRTHRRGLPSADFSVFYHLMSLERNSDVMIKVALSERDLNLPTATRIWPNANWYEREVWDMYGITFTGHPHLTRMLMPPTWQGHPLRKDYPARATEFDPYSLSAAKQDLEQEALRFKPEDWGMKRHGENEDYMFLNLGPNHPSAHGAFRIILQLDGEEIIDCVPEIGYHHRGAEKMAERQSWHSFIPYTDRIDYLGGVMNNLPYVLSVEKLAGIKVPYNTKEALEWGTTGAGLRATGCDFDLRKARPYSGYENFEFEVPLAHNGDAYDRCMVKMGEMRQSLRIIEQCLKNMPEGPYKADHPLTTPPPKERTLQHIETLITHFLQVSWGPVMPANEAFQMIEATKGINSYYLTSDGSTMSYRTRIRTPSFAHLQQIPSVINGSMIADLIAYLGSIDFVMADVDR